MTSRARVAAAVIVASVAGSLLAGCTSGGSKNRAASSLSALPSAGSLGASGAAGGSATRSSSRAFGSAIPGAASSGATATKPTLPSGIPTSLSALPPVPGASGTSTPPITPAGKLSCPSAAAVTRAFGSTYLGDPSDMDPSPSNLLCNYASSGSAPRTLVLSSGDTGHEGYLRMAANIRTVAGPGASVQPVLGLGDEAVVDLEHDGSQTYAAQLLVRYQERNVLIVSNDRSSTLRGLAQLSRLLY